MKNWLDENPNTAIIYVAFLLIIVVGGIVTASGNMSFDDYSTKVVGLAGACGIFGAGRAVKNGLLKKDAGEGLPPEEKTEIDEPFAEIDDDVEFDQGPDEAPADHALVEQFPDDQPVLEGKAGEGQQK